MFEKVTLRRSISGPILSAGELAEALLFYQNIHLILDFISLNHLVSTIGMPTLLSLLSSNFVSAVYCEEALGTRKDKLGIIDLHSFAAVTIVGSREGKKLKTIEDRIRHLLIRRGYDNKKSIKYAKQFIEIVPVRQYNSNYYIKDGIVKAAENDLLDNNFLHKAIRIVLVDLFGEDNVPANFKFTASPLGGGYYIDTNLELNKINNSRNPVLGIVKTEHLLQNILNASSDIILSSYYGGEFYTSSRVSEIIRLKCKELLKRICIESEQIDQFSKIILQNGPDVKYAINSGGRTFSEFLSLLEKSKRFKEWIKGINPDENVVKDYFKEVRAEGWLDKLPVKLFKYIFGLSIEIQFPIAGQVFSAFESLILDKIRIGWRPNHFVEKDLKAFLDKEGE